MQRSQSRSMMLEREGGGVRREGAASGNGWKELPDPVGTELLIV